MHPEPTPEIQSSARDAARQQPVQPAELTAPVGPVTGGSAHDLYNLLAVIIGVCESFADDLGLRPEHRELARVGVLAADRAAQLVDGLRRAAYSNEPAQDDADDAASGLAAVTDLSARRAERQAANEAAAAESLGRRVLLVEDDPDLLLLLTAAFVREGFRTYTAKNGRHGLELLRKLKPDLMVTDIVMPELEGIGAILEARRSAPDTRVIAISGGGHYGRSENFLEWARELGADEVLAKPFRVSSLITAARVVLDRPPLPGAPDLNPGPRLAISR